MRSFIRLYWKDYVMKILSVPMFLIMKLLQFFLLLFSILYGLIKYPVIGFCILGVLVELTSSPIRYAFLLIFFGISSFCILFRYLEVFLFSFLASYTERLKVRILRPVYLKSKIKFTL